MSRFPTAGHLASWAGTRPGNPYLNSALGGDFYTRRNPDKAEQRALHQLHALGYAVTLSPVDTAVAG